MLAILKENVEIRRRNTWFGMILSIYWSFFFVLRRTHKNKAETLILYNERFVMNITTVDNLDPC